VTSNDREGLFGKFFRRSRYRLGDYSAVGKLELQDFKKPTGEKP